MMMIEVGFFFFHRHRYVVALPNIRLPIASMNSCKNIMPFQEIVNNSLLLGRQFFDSQLSLISLGDPYQIALLDEAIW